MPVTSLFVRRLGLTPKFKKKNEDDTSNQDDDEEDFSTDLSSNEDSDFSSHECSSSSSYSVGSSSSSYSVDVEDWSYSTSSSHPSVESQDELETPLWKFLDKVASLFDDNSTEIRASTTLVDASTAYSGAIKEASVAEHTPTMDHLKGIDEDDHPNAISDDNFTVPASIEESASVVEDVRTIDHNLNLKEVDVGDPPIAIGGTSDVYVSAIKEAVAASIADDIQVIGHLEKLFNDSTYTYAIRDASISTSAHASRLLLKEAATTIKVVKASAAYNKASIVFYDALDETAIAIEDIQAIIDADLDEDRDLQARKSQSNQNKTVKEMTFQEKMQQRRAQANKKRAKGEMRAKVSRRKCRALAKEIDKFHQLAETKEKAKNQIKKSKNQINGTKLQQIKQRKKITALSEKYLELEAVNVAPLLARLVQSAASKAIFPYDATLK